MRIISKNILTSPAMNDVLRNDLVNISITRYATRFSLRITHVLDVRLVSGAQTSGPHV